MNGIKTDGKDETMEMDCMHFLVASCLSDPNHKRVTVNALLDPFPFFSSCKF